MSNEDEYDAYTTGVSKTISYHSENPVHPITIKSPSLQSVSATYPYNNYSHLVQAATHNLMIAKNMRDVNSRQALSVSSIFLYLLCPEALINEIWHHKQFGLTDVKLDKTELVSAGLYTQEKYASTIHPRVRWYFAPLKCSNPSTDTFRLSDDEFITITRMVKMRNDYIHTNPPGKREHIPGFEFSKDPNQWTPDDAELIHDKFWAALEKLDGYLGGRLKDFGWMRQRYNE